MSRMPAQESLEIEVKDFGPIVEAKVDLRPLTVFVGPSNTGKSYLAILIYALHRFFSGYGQFGFRDYFYDYVFSLGDPAEKMPQESISALVEWAGQTFADKKRPRDADGFLLPAPISGLLRSWLVEMGGKVDNEICRCFGIGKIGELVRNNSKNSARIVFRKPVPNGSQFFAHELTFDAAEDIAFGTTMPEDAPMWVPGLSADREIGYLSQKAPVNRILAEGTSSDAVDSEVRQMAMEMARLAMPQAIGPLHCPAAYLPADRTGVMHMHELVVRSLIGHATITGLRPAIDTPMLSGVAADFLEQLIRIDKPLHRPHKRVRSFAMLMEQEILDGEVRVERSGVIDYPSFLYRPKGWKRNLPLMNASSMVSELAPLVLYLRHVVCKGDVLIVDEPESHLHPAKQVEFTRQLVAIVNSGVRVIVTTHSEWLLEQLANLVQLSKLPEAERKGVPIGVDALEPDQVGVWLFEPKRRPKGSVVKEIHLDPDSSLYPSGFSDVAEAMHNDWAEMTSRIENVA